MRLVCPNCAAQYEVGDDAIPESGRNVQCASCGDTWFQDKRPASIRVERTRRPAPEPEPEDDIDLAAYDEEEDAPAPAPERAPERARVDPSVLDILRSEAERESAARRAETGSGGDAFDDEDVADEPAHADDLASRAKAARERLKAGRTGGERRLNLTETEEDAAPAPRRTPRRERAQSDLPDVDELNSTLRSAEDKGRKRDEKRRRKKPRRSGRVGFYLAILLALLAAAAYALQGQIGAILPEARPYLETYVDTVNAVRRALDAGFQALIELMRGLMEKYL
jgi:predicted Zn finger-like uncharacterized protein